jgi:hypothetical protein
VGTTNLLATDARPSRPGDESVSRAHARLTWLVVLLIAAVALVSRLLWLMASPPNVGGDETVMVTRTQTLLSGRLPAAYDWPSGSFVLLGALLKPLSAWWPALSVPDGEARYLVARLISVAAGVTLVVLSALLASRLCRDWLRSRVAAWIAASVLAVAFSAVAMSRTAHPEILQDTFVVAALLAALRLHERPGLRIAAAAGAFAGLAAGAKFVGGVVVIVVVVAALTAAMPWRRRLLTVGVALSAAAAAFVVAVPATVVRPVDVLRGINEQTLHSATGHAGFDAPAGALGYHLTQTLPGNLGWPLTVVSLLALGWALVRGTPVRRLVALYVVLASAILAQSHLTFPRYVLLILPALVALAAATAADLASTKRRSTVVGAVVALALVPVALDSARLVVSSSHVRTRALATEVADRLPGTVLAEPYSVEEQYPIGRPRHVRNVPNLGERPEVTRCGCYLVTSSFIVDRFRAEPQRYAAQLAVYDTIRREGTVVAVLRPSIPLDYRWDALPQYGADRVPLRGRAVVGPVVTIYRMPGAEIPRVRA